MCRLRGETWDSACSGIAHGGTAGSGCAYRSAFAPLFFPGRLPLDGQAYFSEQGFKAGVGAQGVEAGFYGQDH